MKKLIDCGIVRFILDQNLDDKVYIFADLHGNSYDTVYTKRQAEKLVIKLKEAIPILEQWVNLIGRKRRSSP
jgi:hypothetical protein